MLHINKITIKNFRPYFGVKVFDFGEKNGLSIVLGDNGIGKTSLLKAIKFVLYGEFDTNNDFKIKNEMNMLAWKKQSFELYVALEFLYNDEKYVLRRHKRVKTNINGDPQTDADFEDYVTVIKNDIVLPYNAAESVLKNIIPKKISEYILFEGETISKYKNLLDKEKNLEIYESIKKILGITTLENSQFDLEHQLQKYEIDKLKLINENEKNEKLKKELSKYSEQLNETKKNETKFQNDLKIILIKKQKCEETLKTNQRMNALMSEKDKYKSELKKIDSEIQFKKQKAKEKLKCYKNYCYEIIASEINNIPNDIQFIKNAYEENQDFEKEIQISKKLINSSYCDYCNQNLNFENKNALNKKINLMESQKTNLTDEQLIKLKEYDQKIDILKSTIEGIEDKDYKSEILNIEIEIQEKLIEEEGCQQTLKSINSQINDLGDFKDIEKVLNDYSVASKNEEVYKNSIDECNAEIQKLKSKIDSILKKNPITINFESIDKKIKTTKNLITVIGKAIDAYSEEMRKRVQEDSTDMFRKISENKEYDHLEFDEHYGLKLIDTNNWVVPNVSSGYMTLITISLIYGLHKNSSLTGTIILDAPFSVLTNFHRDKIIQAFQTLSPQVLLLVYRDQIDLNSIRNTMQGKLINEYEIYQDRNEENSSYKTNIRGVE